MRGQVGAFPPYLASVSVIAYLADDNEIPTAKLVDDIVASGRAFYLPYDATFQGFVQWRPGEPLSVGPGGIRQPAGGAPTQPAQPAIALIPVVGWDDAGTRLGRGGGFYDRLFAATGEGIVRVGLAYECLRFPELPRDPWDIPMHYVITEQRVLRCGGAGLARAGLLQKGGLQL